MQILNHLVRSSPFVHLGTLCSVLGLLTRLKLLMRVFLLLGRSFFNCYDYIGAEGLGGLKTLMERDPVMHNGVDVLLKKSVASNLAASIFGLPKSKPPRQVAVTPV